MGWAKYYEDNCSICIGRMIMKESVSPYHDNYERSHRQKVCVKRQGAREAIKEPVKYKDGNRRKGLELRFINGIEDHMIRTLQLNGWWWSKVKACWCNANTVINREYAEGFLSMGAKIVVIDERW